MLFALSQIKFTSSFPMLAQKAKGTPVAELSNIANSRHHIQAAFFHICISHAFVRGLQAGRVSSYLSTSGRLVTSISLFSVSKGLCPESMSSAARSIPSFILSALPYRYTEPPLVFISTAFRLCPFSRSGMASVILAFSSGVPPHQIIFVQRIKAKIFGSNHRGFEPAATNLADRSRCTP